MPASRQHHRGPRGLVRFRNAGLATLVFSIVAGGYSGQAAEEKVTIPTRDYWAHTGLRVEKGRAYRVRVVDFSTVRDSTIRVPDLNGWPSAFTRLLYSRFAWLKRQPCEPWFSVIATIDRKAPVRLKSSEPYVAPASGELVCYFNDLPITYCNNHGAGTLGFTPITPRPANAPAARPVRRSRGSLR